MTNDLALARSARRPGEGRQTSGGLAFAALLVFMFLVYSNPGNWFDGLEDIGFAKIAAGAAMLALGGAWLLYGHRVGLGGAPGVMLLGFYLLIAFSALWSYWPKASIDAFAEEVKYVSIFFVAANVIDSHKRLHWFFSALALASVIPAFGAIHSWATGTHLVDGDRVGWIGIFGNPNDLAYHLVIGVAMLLAVREATHRRWLKLVYLALLVPMGIGVLLTQSRGGMLATGVVVALWVVRSVKRAPAAVGVALALACVWMLGSPTSTFEKRMESSVAYGEDMSARGRLDAWRTGMNMVEERPWTGVGAGAFMVAWPDFAPGDAGPVRTEHNTFVQVSSELGIPALLFFVGALAAGILGVSRAAKTERLSPYARGAQCGLAGFAVCSLWGGIAFSWPLYLLLGVSVAIHRFALEQQLPVADVLLARHRLAGAV